MIGTSRLRIFSKALQALDEISHCDSNYSYFDNNNIAIIDAQVNRRKVNVSSVFNSEGYIILYFLALLLATDTSDQIY